MNKVLRSFAALLVAGSFSFGSMSVMASEDFNAAWEAADAKRKEAAAVGFEWRDTGKILKQAKAAADEGDMDQAMKLVAKAHEQSEDAIAQQAREENLWQARVPQ